MNVELNNLINPLREYIGSEKHEPGASEELIERLKSSCNRTLPEEYLELLRFCNGGEGTLGGSDESYISLWSVEDAIWANGMEGYSSIKDDHPELFLFGKNAATAAFGLDTTKSTMPVIEADFIDPDYYEHRADDFISFLRLMANS